MNSPSPVVQCENVSFRYGATEAVKDISFSLEAGEYAGLVGGNGSGKTTLLKLLLGLLRPHAGSVRLFGVPVAEFTEWQRIGYVPQHVFRTDAGFPATVREIVESGHPAKPYKMIHSLSGGPGCERAETALKKAGIEHLAEALIGELSGGERQRVYVARALVSEPELLVLDEPTTGIDAESEKNFYRILEELNHSGMTIILVSHDLEAVSRAVKTVLCINQRLVCHGDPSALDEAAVLGKLYGAGRKMLRHEHEHREEAQGFFS